jgi:hypothetical protein
VIFIQKPKILILKYFKPSSRALLIKIGIKNIDLAMYSNIDIFDIIFTKLFMFTHTNSHFSKKKYVETIFAPDFKLRKK